MKEKSSTCNKGRELEPQKMENQINKKYLIFLLFNRVLPVLTFFKNNFIWWDVKGCLHWGGPTEMCLGTCLIPPVAK